MKVQIFEFWQKFSEKSASFGLPVDLILQYKFRSTLGGSTL